MAVDLSACCLCRLKFLAPNRRLGADKQQKWAQRALGVVLDRDDSPEPELTPLGTVKNHVLVGKRQPEDETFELPLLQPTEDFFVFAFHEFCWTVLLGRTRGFALESNYEAHVAKQLFNLLISQQWGRAPFLGSASYCTHSNFAQLDVAYLIAEDKKSPGLDSKQGPSDQENSNEHSSTPPLAPPVPLPTRQKLQSNEQQAQGPFSGMPQEIICRVLALLTSTDACNFRLSSRSVAAASSPLPQSFWASRFSPGREFGYYFAHLPREANTVGLDWRSLYQSVNNADATHPKWARQGSPLDLRENIVDEIERLAMPLESLLLGSLSSPEALSRGTTSDPKAPRGSVVGQCVKCPTSSRPNRVLNDEFLSHIFYTASIHWDLESRESSVFVGASLLQSDGNSYISGLRVFHQDSMSRHGNISEAGLIVPSRETVILLEPSETVIDIGVTMSLQGIRALDFVVRQSDGTPMTKSLGSADMNDTSIGVARLTSQSKIVGLMLEFDACKAFAAHLLSSENHNQDPLPQASFAYPQKLWNPSVPHGTILFPEPKPFPHDPENMMINFYMPFGGEDGSMLAKLCRITGLIDSKAGLQSFGFAYDDGSEEVYGLARQNPTRRSACVEQSYFIKGAEGERISHMELSIQDVSWTGSPAQYVHAVKIFTNFERELLFCCRSRAVVLQRELDSTFNVRPSAGSTPIAMIASLQAPGRALETLEFCGVLVDREARSSASGEKRLGITSPTGFGCHFKVAPWMAQLDQNLCFTMCSLQNLSAIQVYAERESYNGPLEFISGLGFEYTDGMPNSIVGRVVHTNGSVTFDKGEKLVGISTISVRQSNQQHNNSTSGILGIKFLTSKGRNLVFQRTQAANGQIPEIVEHQASPYESMSSLLWAFGASRDIVQPLLAPSFSNAGERLVFFVSDRTGCIKDRLNESRLECGYGENSAIEPLNEEQIGADRYNTKRVSIFWAEVAVSGRRAKLKSISVAVDGGRLVGIRFNYEEGDMRLLGRMNDAAITWTLEEDERLVSLTTVGDDIVSGLEFVTSNGRLWQTPQGPSRPMQSPRCYALRFDVESHVTQSTAGDKPAVYYKLPREHSSGYSFGESVGIWFTLEQMCNGTANILAAGPISIASLTGERQ